MPEGLFKIRDIDDYPVLCSAMIYSVDALITGDKDFMGINITRPMILTPAEFIEQFMRYGQTVWPTP